MRFIFSIALFFSLQSNGQVINASRPYSPFTIASCSYLLDTYSGAAAAYSLRKLDCDYSGYAIRVRLSSNNAEQDIGFTSAGDLDTASLKSFIGSNSGYVVTWYDQSGNGSNVTQSTAGNQPRIVNAGVIDRQNGRPAIFFSEASSTYLNGGDILDMTELYFNTFSTVKFSSTTGAAFGKSKNSADSDIWSLLYDASLYSLYYDAGGAIKNTSAESDANYNIYQTYISKSGDTNQLKKNNTQVAINTSSINDGYTGNGNSFFVGVYQNASGNAPLSGYYLDGYIGEIIVYRKFWNSSERTGINNNINYYYSIY